jgi:hypothetical protein
MVLVTIMEGKEFHYINFVVVVCTIDIVVQSLT